MDTERDIMERKGWIALLLGMTMPGMGQIYNGEAVKGICVFVIFIMTYLAGWRLVVLLPDRLLMTGAAITLAIVLAVYCLAIIDSYRKARREGTAYRVRAFNRWYVYVAVWLVESVLVMGGVVTYRRRQHGTEGDARGQNFRG
jgi:signal peptidase I